MIFIKGLVAILFVAGTFALGLSFIYQGIALVSQVKWIPMVQNIALLLYVVSFVLCQFVLK